MFALVRQSRSLASIAEVVLAISLSATLFAGVVEIALLSAQAEAASLAACEEAAHRPLGHRIRWC